jgi:ubiquinone/menaquinone biosynthesis C-methylase UbiE
MDLIELKQAEKNFKRHPWEQARLKIFLFFLKKHISRKETIADIGSGDAFIAKSLASTFPHSSIFAVDIHYSQEVESAIGEQTLNNIFFITDPSYIKLQTPSIVDLIIIMDVLEHVEKPGKFLEELKRLANVTTNTQFFITVPAFQSLFTEHDAILGHYKRYTKRELNQLLKLHGMQIEFSGYFFCSLLLIRALQKIFQRDFSKDGVHNWKGSQFLTLLITSFFWIEFKISWYLSRLRISIPGLTCYCLCRPLPS